MSHASKWGVSEEEAEEYGEWVLTNKHFVCGIIVAILIFSEGQAMPALLVVVSTGATTRTQKANTRVHDEGWGIVDPWWLHIELYLYKGLAFLNCSGLADSKYKPQQLDSPLGEYLRPSFPCPLPSSININKHNKITKSTYRNSKRSSITWTVFVIHTILN